MLIGLLVILLLIAVNALFVAGEFAAVSVSHSHVKELAEDKHWAARYLWPVLEDSHAFDSYIAACQVGITISSLILGAYGQAQISSWLAPWLGEMQSHYLVTSGILVGLTVLQMLMGELIPKSLALQYPLGSALWTTLPMIAALWVLRLPIAVLNGSGNLLLKAMGFQPEAHRHIHSPDEIKMLLSQGEDAGVLDRDSRQRMQNALRISDWTARDLMVPRPYLQMLDLKLAHRKNLKKIMRAQSSTLLVYEENPDQVKGYIRCEEVLRYVLIQGKIDSFESFIHPLLIIPRSLTIQRALDKFRSHRTRLALVVDEYGGVAGLLTLRDIVAELTGVMGDEFTSPRSSYHVLPDGRLRISGQMRLDHLDSQLQISWPSEYSLTVNGFLLSHLDGLPARGTQLEIDGLTIEVEKVSSHAILSVLISPQVVRT